MTLGLRSLGGSELQVSAIGLGCWQFSKGKNLVGRFWPALPQETIAQVVKASVDAGITWFDTAEVYGGGESERALAQALKTVGVAPGTVTVASKWWPLARTAGSITGTIDERLRCLHPYPIDLYQIHQPFSLSPVSAQMRAMARLVEAGKIRYVGVSNFAAKRMREAHRALALQGLHLVSNQMKYSLLDRRIEQDGVLDTARELGISIIAYSPLEQGILTGRFHEPESSPQNLSRMRRMSGNYRPASLARSRPVIEALKEVAKGHQATVAQIALAWLLQAHGDAIVAIPGASSVRQVQSNAGAMQIELTASEIAALSKVGAR